MRPGVPGGDEDLPGGPRPLRQQAGKRDASGGDALTGYLYVSADHPWPLDRPGIIERLPETWLIGENGGEEIDPNRQKALPEPVWVHVDGSRAADGDGVRAAYVPSPFRFCLRCRVSYESARGSDYSKLASLGSEGRSSATTVLSASLVRNLSGEQSGLPPEARKLLAFSDNRQDASLQSGHFNDFVQVGLLRSALYQAVRGPRRNRPRLAGGRQLPPVPGSRARLADHHAQPRADRPAGNPLRVAR